MFILGENLKKKQRHITNDSSITGDSCKNDYHFIRHTCTLCLIVTCIRLVCGGVSAGRGGGGCGGGMSYSDNC